MAGNGESPEVKLAVAVNDIEWMKKAMTDTQKAVTDLSSSVNSFMDAQETRVASKEDLRTLDQRVRKLEGWRNWLTGAYVVIVGFFVMLFEYGKQWLGGGGHP